MAKSSLAVIRAALLTKPHIWVIAAITVFLILIYSFWPWREELFTYGTGRVFGWLIALDSWAQFEFSHYFTGSLFILPIIYASLVYKWKGALIVLVISLTYSLLQVGLWSTYFSIITNSALLALPAAVIVAGDIALDSYRKDKRIIAEREKERKLYMSKVLEAQETERKHLAQELHDETMQKLLLVANDIEILESVIDSDPLCVKRKMASSKEIIRNTVEELRRINLDLRPSILDDLGLIPALKWLVNCSNRECNIDIQFIANDFERKLNPKVDVNIFRIIQEALHNIQRHSKASNAVIKLEFEDKLLKIDIHDNGQGFAPPQKLLHLATEEKLGLIGMSERINVLDGNFEIYSNQSEGTRLLIKIPLSTQSAR